MSDKIKEWLPIISALSAVVAALLSGYISLKVVQLQTDTQILKTQTQDSVERARLFKELIADLSRDDKARYALLALFKIYQKKQDQKIVILAALESSNKNIIHSLINLGLHDQLESHWDTILSIAKSGNGDSAKHAKTILLKSAPMHAAKYLIHSLQQPSNRFRNPAEVDRLIQFAERNKDIQDMMQSHITNNPSLNSELFAYMLYKIGNKDEFNKVLNTLSSDPGKFETVVKLHDFVEEMELDENDREIIKDCAHKYLEMGEPKDLVLAGKAFRIINLYKKEDKLISPNEKKALIAIGRKFALWKNGVGPMRSIALESLAVWDFDEFSKTLTTMMACENLNGSFLKREIGNILNMKQSTNKLPSVNEDKKKWIAWIKKQYPDESSNYLSCTY